ncbi:unnamed protein product, partial [Chrysoparadoxa australica]
STAISSTPVTGTPSDLLSISSTRTSNSCLLQDTTHVSCCQHAHAIARTHYAEHEARVWSGTNTWLAHPEVWW